MRRVRLFMALLALTVGGVNSSYADDVFKDITSDKITNPSFEAANATIAETNATGDLTTGWKIVTIDYARIAIFDNNDVPASNTYGASNPSDGSYYLMVRSNLTDNTRTQNIQQKDAFSLPYGTYQISYDYKAAKCSSYAMSFTISAKDGSTAKGSKQTSITQISANQSYFSGQNWTNGSFNFSLTETKDITLDISCTTRGVSSGHTVILLDNFILKWNLTKSLTDLLSDANTFYDEEGTSYTALKSAIDAADAVKESSDASTLETQYNALAAAFDLAKNHRKPWLAAWTTANTNYASATYVNVTGTEKTALKTEIDKSEPSTANTYDSAASDLTTANSAFTAAKTNYDKYAAEVVNATALGVDPVPALDVASNVQTVLNSIYVLEDAAVATSYTVDATGVIGSWTPQNADSKTDAEHWSGSSKKYYNHSEQWGFTMSVSKTMTLPAGKYVFKAAARAKAGGVWDDAMTLQVTDESNVPFNPQGGSGRGITTLGAVKYEEVDDTYANSNNGYGWEWRFLPFELTDEKSVTMKVEAICKNDYSWASFSDITLLTTTENVELFRQMWNASKTTAETTRDANTYNNVKGSERQGLLDAIDAAVTASIDWYTSQKATLDEAIATFTAAKTNYDNLATSISNANGIVTASINVGNGPFQVPTSIKTTLSEAASSATNTWNNAVTTSADAATAATTLNTAISTYNNDFATAVLNAPSDGQVFNIVNVSDGYDYKDYAVTFKAALAADLSGNTTTIGYRETVSSTYPQDITFIADAGTTNGYKICYTRADGHTIYLGTGSSTGLGSNNYQIRPTTDITKAVVLQIVPSTTTNGVWNLKNTLANANIGASGKSDAGFYTNSSYNNMTIQTAAKNELAVNINDVVKFGTLIAPFNTALPDGLKAYTADVINGTTVTLSVASSIEANTPYVLFASDGYDGTLSGYGARYTDDSYEVGLLTGVYADTPAPVGSYVLQNNATYGVGFYKVADSKQPTVRANKVYLSAPTPARSLSFSFGDETTALETIKALTSGKKTIYNAAGAEVPTLQKGLNIIKMEDGTTRKIMVK